MNMINVVLHSLFGESMKLNTHSDIVIYMKMFSVSLQKYAKVQF